MSAQGLLSCSVFSGGGFAMLRVHIATEVVA